MKVDKNHITNVLISMIFSLIPTIIYHMSISMICDNEIKPYLNFIDNELEEYHNIRYYNSFMQENTYLIREIRFAFLNSGNECPGCTHLLSCIVIALLTWLIYSYTRDYSLKDKAVIEFGKYYAILIGVLNFILTIVFINESYDYALSIVSNLFSTSTIALATLSFFAWVYANRNKSRFR